ncbi:MAG TPA: hypothetical protein VIM34_22825 [Burkholderiaceae bacterium]
MAMTLCELASAPGSGSIPVSEPELIAELVDVDELFVNPFRCEPLRDMGPWWLGRPRRTISEGKAELLCCTVRN